MFSKLKIQIVVYKIDHIIIIIFQKKRRDSVMKTDTFGVQAEKKMAVLAQKDSIIRPRPRPKTARTNR
jgi:hypothetical protein